MVDFTLPGEVPVTFDVVCRTSRDGAGVRHPVTIHPDGSVVTPHDLALERIAAAMGGYLTCLELVDRFVPCLRRLWLHRLRAAAPGIARRGSRWRVAERVAGCLCERTSWSKPEEAAAHLREPAHWGLHHGVEPRRMRAWLAQFERDGVTIPPPPRWEGAITAEVVHHDDPAWLWSVGIGPDTVHRIHAALGLDDPLRAATYLDVAVGDVDLAWLSRLAPFGADAVAWASATHSALDVQRPDERPAWLAAGLSRRLTLPLLGGPYSVADVRRLAGEAGLELNEAGHVLVDWLAAHCEPSIDEVVRLHRLDLTRYAPSGAAIAALRERAPGLVARLTTTELGIAIVEAGTVPAAIAALRRRACGLAGAAKGAA